MRGAMVIVRTYNDRPLVCRVWDSDEQGVDITDDFQFQLLITGHDGLEPIRFPRKDIFKYEQKLAESMEELYNSKKWDWNKLECWDETT